MYERLKTYLIFICTSMRAQVVFFDLKKNFSPLSLSKTFNIEWAFLCKDLSLFNGFKRGQLFGNGCPFNYWNMRQTSFKWWGFFSLN